MDLYYYFTHAALIVEFLPIIPAVIYYRRLPIKYRLFMFYLLYGFLTDVFKPWISSDEIKRILTHIYSVFEIPFLFWFIGEGITNKRVKAFVIPAMILVILFWFYCHFVYESSPLLFSALYDNTTYIMVAAAAAYSLLILTQEDTDIFAIPDFWFMTGLFFYFFIAGFLFNFIESELLKKIWFIHAIISIISMLIITKAFFVIGKQPESER